MKSQNDKILTALGKKPITSWQIIGRFKCARPGARIYDLRNAGHIIHTEIIRNEGESHYAKYTLEY